jgi:hypothetical protein
MVLDYIPVGFDKLNEFFKDTEYSDDRLSQEEIVLDLIDNRFCRYLYRDGINSGLICDVKSKNSIKDNCCSQHLKDLFPNLYKERKEKQKKYYIKKLKNKENIYYCNSKSLRRDRCGRKVKNIGDFCYAHKHEYILKINRICFVFLELTFLIMIIIYIFFIFISIINICKKQEKIICFGSLKIQLDKKTKTKIFV